MDRRVLVIGGGIEGVQTALDLADCGIRVTVVEASSTLQPNSLGQTSSRAETLLLMPKLLRAASHPNINTITNADVVQVRGEKGDFKVTVVERARHVRADICTSCGRCERECPVDIIVAKAKNKHKAIHRPDSGVKSVPSTYSIEKGGVPPCVAACPAGVNAHGYIALISKGKFAEALDLITESVPFPRVLGRVCNRPCESQCTRARIDQAVSICALKRFVADNNSTESSLQRAHELNSGVKPTGPPRVAIIGAGPAGLTAARDLARLGHRSTVFEALPVPGGMITVGMPRFRLPREIRQADINDILKLGIEIKTSTPIGPDLTLEDLKSQGYEAILIATGAHKNQRLGISGENLAGVVDSIALLKALNLRQPITVGSKVVIIGGGYTAVDSARTAVRLSCTRVIILYRRSQEEMPANAEEVAEAREEGVEIEFLVAPVRIIGYEGKVAGVECIRMKLGEPDKSGRRRPIPVGGSEFVVEADTVIVAVGQRPDLSFLKGDTALTDGRRHIVVDPNTMATQVPGIFAAGDVAGEPGTMIEAVAAGRQAAISIDRFLRGEELKYSRSKVVPVEVNVEEVFVPPIKRQPMPSLEHKARVGNFEEVNLGFNIDAAVKEAKRCLNCGGCSECLECVRACELNAIDHNSVAKSLEVEVNAIIATGNNSSEPTPIRPGIYPVAPFLSKDLSRASAAAAEVMVDLAKTQGVDRGIRKISLEVDVCEKLAERKKENLEPRIGVFVCGCGGSISEVIDIPSVIEYCRGLDGITYSSAISYACVEEAAREIKDMIREHNLTHIVLAACSCCSLDQICFSCSDRRVACKSNLLADNRLGVSYEFVNIREHCAWVHRTQPEKATTKAKNLIRGGIVRVRLSSLPPNKELAVDKSVLVVGDGLSGMQAAANLSTLGFETILIGNNGIQFDYSDQYRSLKQHLESELADNRATVLPGAKLLNIEGTAGKYRATIMQKGKPLKLTAGAIVLDLNAKTKLDPLLMKATGNGSKSAHFILEPAVSQLLGVFLCGMGQTLNTVEAMIQGAAAATKASVWLNKKMPDTKQTVVTVDQYKCRGCGTCASICQSGAIALVEKNSGVFTAEVDEGLCQGCGMCTAHCPSGALSQYGYSDDAITASLKAVLS